MKQKSVMGQGVTRFVLPENSGIILKYATQLEN